MGTTPSVYIHITPLILSGIVGLVGQSNDSNHYSITLGCYNYPEVYRGTCPLWVSFHILFIFYHLSLIHYMHGPIIHLSKCISVSSYCKQVVRLPSTSEKHIWEHYTKSYTKTSIATSLKCLVMPQTYVNTLNQASLTPLEFNTQTYA